MLVSGEDSGVLASGIPITARGDGNLRGIRHYARLGPLRSGRPNPYFDGIGANRSLGAAHRPTASAIFHNKHLLELTYQPFHPMARA